MADTVVTAQTVIDNSLARQKDPDDTQWTDANLLNYINKAVSYIHMKLIQMNNELAVSTGTIAMVASTQEYDLSGNLDNFYKMCPNGVYFTEPLTKISLEDAKRAGATTTATAPTAYYLTAAKIGVVYTPTAAAVVLAPTLYCRYFAKETTLALGTTMPYKNLFNEAISTFASSLALFKTEESSAEYLSVYNALEESTMEIASKR